MVIVLVGHLSAGNRAGCYSSSPVLQKAGSGFPSSNHEPNREPIRRPIARLRHCYKRSPKVRRVSPNASRCFSRAGGVS